jgi:hypothetical protein
VAYYQSIKSCFVDISIFVDIERSRVGLQSSLNTPNQLGYTQHLIFAEQGAG